ncbi:MAG: hypothetical protein M0R33_17100 [Methylomonas sp.]|jgi:DNA-directed RNA polymerase beta subunit|uniref:DNA-directed RNA polymerase subunit beta n=1 Tax=Methylomonas sp. TaxID=418 RepID=UPI0025F2F391|nr:hypothetical protein [Methylomonas sp.]MCK9608164.1 hypothetical protein [Methylomonas sp.]
MDSKAQDKDDPAPKKTATPDAGGVLKMRETDSGVTSQDLMALLRCAYLCKKPAGHHLRSMNFFYHTGLRQIITDIFKIEGVIKNTREATQEDKSIESIHFEVKFSNVKCESPSIAKVRSGLPELLTPNYARKMSLTYAIRTTVDVSMIATAVMVGTPHSEKRIEEKLIGHHLAQIQCMVGSDLCTTAGRSREALIEMEEDPNDALGYFILNGGEWSVDCLENITSNLAHIFKNMYENEVARLNFLSKFGDAFENSNKLTVIYTTSGAIEVQFQTNQKEQELTVPFYVIFRAFGMTSDVDIVNTIVGDCTLTDPITTTLLDVIDRAYLAQTRIGTHSAQQRPGAESEQSVESSAKIVHEYDTAEILLWLAAKAKAIPRHGDEMKNEEFKRKAAEEMRNICNTRIFQHMGASDADVGRKLRLLGYLIYKLLLVALGIMEQTDRDSYRTKRVHAAGISLAKAFKTDFNIAVVHEIRKRLRKAFESSSFSEVRMSEQVSRVLAEDKLHQLLSQAISTGNKILKVRQQTVTNRVASQAFYRKNDAHSISVNGSISVQNAGPNKHNIRADEIRRVHSTYAGFIDVSQSADSGMKVGISKQITIATTITDASSSIMLKTLIREDKAIMSVDAVTTQEIVRNKLSRVFVNGDWIGCCTEDHLLVARYRKLRREHPELIHRHTSIYWDINLREVYFWTDYGRLVRPFLLVFNNLEEYDAECLEAKKKGIAPPPTSKFHQWLAIRREHVEMLHNMKPEIAMEKLAEEGVIEYLTPDEFENCLVAKNIDVLREDAHSITMRYTHCEIEQAIFGVVMLSSPLVNCSNAARSTMWTCHRRSSSNWFTLNYPYRVDKNTMLQYYCEYPIVSSFSDSLMNPNGLNAIVALIVHTGRNQEDSVVFNGSSRARGMYSGAFYSYEFSELEKGERFEPPPAENVADRRHEAVYSHLGRDGMPPIGTEIKKGYVLIAKTAVIQKTHETGKPSFVDKSIVYRWETPAVVDNVILCESDQHPLAKVRWRQEKSPIVGDKLSSRMGNKGIISYIVPECDMPYEEKTGMRPDILVNAHSIPARRAINQLIESMLGTLGACWGCHIDATCFQRFDISRAIAELEKFGIKYGGQRRLYNGMSGDWLDTQIFIGPTVYQRHQKFADMDQYAAWVGPTNALSHQPFGGKQNDGSLKISEMENDVIEAQGSMRALCEKFYECSDGCMIYVCRNCGKRAIVNTTENIFECAFCNEMADIVSVPSSWVANLFLNELVAMGVGTTLEMEKPVL